MSEEALRASSWAWLLESIRLAMEDGTFHYPMLNELVAERVVAAYELRSWQGEYASFSDYCVSVWGMVPTTAYYLVRKHKKRSGVSIDFRRRGVGSETVGR